MAQEIPAKYIKLTPEQAGQALSDAYSRVAGKKPSALILGLMMGQTALETGNWNLPNYNWGGVKWGASDPYYQYLPCSEVENGVETHYTGADPHCKFAAYKSAADGAERYVRTLKNRDTWWKGLQTGSVSGFISGLTAPPFKYFTADPAKYASILDDRAAHYASVAKQYAGSNWFKTAALVFTAIVGGAFVKKAIDKAREG